MALEEAAVDEAPAEEAGGAEVGCAAGSEAHAASATAQAIATIWVARVDTDDICFSCLELDWR